MTRTTARDLLILSLLCYVAFWWRLGQIGLIDPDEPFYAQTAREMVETNDWITPHIFGAPQFEKPIFYYWLVAASFKLFGQTEFAGRASTALAGSLIVLMTYAFTRRVFNQRAGLLSSIVLATGLEFIIMSRLMLTDIALALFLAGAFFCYWLAGAESARRNVCIFLHLAFIGLAVLMKGPIGFLFPALGIPAYAWATKRPLLYRGAGFWTGALVCALIAVPWYAVMLWKFGWEYFNDFFIHENVMRLLRAEHRANNHFYYYPGVLALGSIPWMPLLAVMLSRSLRGIRSDERVFFLWCWSLTSLGFLTIVQSKLPSYIFFLFVPLAIMLGTTLDSLLSDGFRSVFERRLAIAVAAIQFVATLVAPFIKVAKPFTTPALLAGACLGIALVFLFKLQLRAWFLANAMTMLVLVGAALIIVAPNVDAVSSARPLAQAVLQHRKNDEPIISTKFLVRGVTFYTRAGVSVYGMSGKTFWTPHRALSSVDGKEGLNELLREHGSAIFALRLGDWNDLSKDGVIETHEAFETMGDKVMVRALAPGARTSVQR
jgi:4-amino-4-deoxy-L-arabinose transferase-like glycosyltransferase